MNTAKTVTRFAWLAVAGLLLSACANQMEPAKQAIDNIDSTVNAAAADAGRYVPEQLADVRAKLGELKATYEKKDYKAVIAGAPAVLTAAQGLASAAAAKKDEAMKAATEQWTTLSASVPKLVETVKSRVDVLSKSRKPPAGVDLATAKTELAAATDAWTRAQTASTSGNAEEAANQAKMAQEKATAAATALKLTLPAP